MIPITDPLFYLLAVPTLLPTGISKGGFASGGGDLPPAISLDHRESPGVWSLICSAGARADSYQSGSYPQALR